MSMICFDVDGTLFDNSIGKVSESTIDTILKLQKKHKVFIATGRSFDAIKELGLLDKIKWDGLILNNGQYIVNKDFETVYAEYLDSNAINEIIELCKNDSRLNLSLITEKDWYLIKESNPQVDETHRFFNVSTPYVKPFNNESVIMALLYTPLNMDYSEFYKIDHVNIIPGVAPYADICVLGSSKYKGIEKMMNYLGEHEYIAFGDANNDLEMIKHAKIGIAMGQGTKEIKEIADFITLSCSDEGITYACEVLNLL